MKAPKWLIQATGNIYLHPWPMWIIYRPNHHRVRGDTIRQVLDVLRPGDVLLRRFNGYLNTYLTPGYWGHAGLYIGDDKVIHAISQGVIKEDVLNFLRCDAICVLRVGHGHLTAIERAHGLLGHEYDYDFSAYNDAFYCTEFVDFCYCWTFKADYQVVVGNRVLLPDGIYTSWAPKRVFEFRG